MIFFRPPPASFKKNCFAIFAFSGGPNSVVLTFFSATSLVFFLNGGGSTSQNFLNGRGVQILDFCAGFFGHLPHFFFLIRGLLVLEGGIHLPCFFLIGGGSFVGYFCIF